MMAYGCWVQHLVMVVCLVASTSAVVYPSPNPRETEASYWYELMREEIQQALVRPRNTGKAKNVLLFLGDGMGITVSTAGRILKGQKKAVSGEEGHLIWERFPNTALLKTYTVDKQVADSAGAANAYLSGVKTRSRMVGLAGGVDYSDCDASLLPENRLDSILKWAQDAGKDTGIVTTAHVTDGTPAALYAKAANRYWQCDTSMAEDNATHCVDIARQLIHEEPGKSIKVIMGGGRQEMGAPLEKTKQWCPRSDGRNLVEEWQEEKEAQGAKHAYLTTTRQLRDVDPETTDFLLGLFGERRMPYEINRDLSPEGTPSLKEMTQVALKVLQKNPKGFFLLVEGSNIDMALHWSKPRLALEEVVTLDETVEAALKMVDLEETLVVVTADHSHSMTMNGYPTRGNDILGVVTNRYVTDGLPYTTLMFATGEGYNFTWDGEKVVRRNLTGVDTTHQDFVSLAAVPTVEGEEAHGGEEVAVYAIGPMSHLFHRLHEQTYVAHVMGYASCIGPYKDNCSRPLDTTPEDSSSYLVDILGLRNSSGNVQQDSHESDSYQNMAPGGAQTELGENVQDTEKKLEQNPAERHIKLMKDEDDDGDGEDEDDDGDGEDDADDADIEE